MRATILVGSGRYQDRWHDFAATGQATARALERLGIEARMRAFKPEGVAEIEQSDLLVVNSGNGAYSVASDGPESGWIDAFDHLRSYRARGGPILALHAASNSLEGLPEWPEWIAGSWERGVSMHPPIGEATVAVSPVPHPITHEMEGFTLYDEMYSYLKTTPAARVLLTHRFEGTDHPLVWASESDGARAVYDALGHSPRAFDSEGRFDLFAREVGWLLRR